jgi:hypothetical protein
MVRLERAVSGARSSRAVCVPGVYGAEHRWKYERSCRPVASLGSLRFRCYESGDPRGFFCEFDAWGPNAFDGFGQRVQSFQAASGYAEIFYCEDSDGRCHFSILCFHLEGAVLAIGSRDWCRDFWTMAKGTLGYRVLSYVDDYAIDPSLGRPASLADFRRASRRLDALLLRYGLTRHPSKGVWGDGSQCLQHLGFVVDTVRGLFGIRRRSWMRFRAFPCSW